VVVHEAAILDKRCIEALFGIKDKALAESLLELPGLGLDLL
jgi:hypothetical protein